MVQGTQELAAHHAVDTSSQRNSDYRLSKIGIVAQSLHFSPPIPSLALILDSLSLEWALTRLQASRLAESIKRIEVAQHYTSHTPSGKPDSDVQHYMHLSHPWGCALGQPVRQASGLVREGERTSPKIRIWIQSSPFVFIDTGCTTTIVSTNYSNQVISGHIFG